MFQRQAGARPHLNLISAKGSRSAGRSGSAPAAPGSSTIGAPIREELARTSAPGRARPSHRMAARSLGSAPVITDHPDCYHGLPPIACSRFKYGRRRRPSTLQSLGNPVGQLACHLVLGHAWPFLGSGVRNQDHRILGPAHDTGCRAHVIGNDPIAPFAQSLGCGVVDHIISFSAANPTTSGGRFAPCSRETRFRMSGFSANSSDRQAIACFSSACLSDALKPHASRRPRRRTRPHPPAERCVYGVRHLSRGTLHPHHLHTRSGGGTSAGPVTKTTSAPRFRQSARDSGALSPRGAIGDVTHRVDGLVRRAGCHQDALARAAALRPDN